MARARILAVDDQRYFRELVSGMLAEEGFEAETASSAEEALRVLEAGASFDVILTDLVMPGMDGCELVHRVKQRDPEQAIVVVTGVVDVKTAVDAMKVGATDYLLKPFDRRTLAVTLDGILQKRELQSEHARLLEENIEYLGERSLYERAFSLFPALSPEPVAMRIADALCHETRAQGAVVWLASEQEPDLLDLSAARGLVRLADEPEELRVGELPEGLRDERVVFAPWGPDGAEALYGVTRAEGRIAGVVRLSDKLEGERFDAVDGACVAKFLRFADVAVANALRVRGLERRGLRDWTTGAYHLEYFEDATRLEIEKAGRFGRSFALVQIDLGGPTTLQRFAEGESLRELLRATADHLRRLLRATDLLAVDESWRFWMLLPEADALGAAVLKRRALRALAEDGPLAELGAHARPPLHAASAIFPYDGEQLDTLIEALGERLVLERESVVARLGLEALPLAESLRALLREAPEARTGTAQQLARFAIAEVRRQPRERGLLFTAPGASLAGAVREGLEALRDVPLATELLVVSGGERPDFPLPAVSWIDPAPDADLPPCLVRYGDGPVYALVGADDARFFHTDDRCVVEHLALRLQEEIGGEASA